MRIFHVAGPGDIIGAYRHWREGHDPPSLLAVGYATMFYDECRERGAEVYAISYNSRKEILHDGKFTIEHRPRTGGNLGGILYHLSVIWYDLRLIWTALRFRADVAILAGGAESYFLYPLLTIFGTKVVPSFHCVLWTKHGEIRRSRRLALSLNRRFLTRGAFAMMAVSNDITEQVKALTKGQHPPIIEFLPSYREQAFAGIADPDATARPFRVMFAGRIEANKGVFDLLKVAEGLYSKGRKEIVFDVCGEGSALKPLKAAARKAGVEEAFMCHGYCMRDEILRIYGNSHVVIAPTTTGFVEGFNKVVAEGILAKRPVITSSVCPALAYVEDAVVEVPPDDVGAYETAILSLADDLDLYEAKSAAAWKLRKQFFDEGRSWGSAFRRVLVAAETGRTPDAVSWAGY
jgi:glycosyltransferase involved in cell wall biosynthesis